MLSNAVLITYYLFVIVMVVFPRKDIKKVKKLGENAENCFTC